MARKDETPPGSRWTLPDQQSEAASSPAVHPKAAELSVHHILKLGSCQMSTTNWEYVISRKVEESKSPQIGQAVEAVEVVEVGWVPGGKRRIVLGIWVIGDRAER